MGGIRRCFRILLDYLVNLAWMGDVPSAGDRFSPVPTRTTGSEPLRLGGGLGEIFRLANPPLAKCCRDRNPAVSARVSIEASPAPKRRWLTRMSCP